ncbi:hypothetical protein Tco_1427964 [Tanacetum coccineum]
MTGYCATVQGRHRKNYSGHMYKGNATSSRGNAGKWAGKVLVKCYNSQGGRTNARQCTQLKHQGMQHVTRKQYPGIPASQVQTNIPHTATFQTEDLDTYDSDCDDLSTTQAVLMANISNYGSDIVSEVPNSETYLHG